MSICLFIGNLKFHIYAYRWMNIHVFIYIYIYIFICFDFSKFILIVLNEWNFKNSYELCWSLFWGKIYDFMLILLTRATISMEPNNTVFLLLWRDSSVTRLHSQKALESIETFSKFFPWHNDSKHWCKENKCIHSSSK